LTPSTSYDFVLIGLFANGVESQFGSVSAVFVTGPANPKQNPNIDITNFLCTQVRNNNTNRQNIRCNWNPPKPPSNINVIEIETKCRCTSLQRAPVFIRKDLAPATTTALYMVNRDVATCVVWVRAVYTRNGFINGRHLYGSRQQALVILN